MKRTPMPQRRSTLRQASSLRRTALRTRSVKRRREERVYSALRLEFLALNPECAWPDCADPATTVQHSEGRIGDRYLDVLTWLPSCWAHNGYAEDHPSEARAAGFSFSRLAKKAATS